MVYLRQIALLFLLSVIALPLWAEDGKERFKVAVLSNFPPQYMLDTQGEPTGFAIEVIEEVAKIANIEIEYVIVDS